MRFHRLFLVLSLSFGSFSAARADELSWQTLLIKGEGKAAICNDSTVITSYAGNNAAFIFTNLAVNIPANTPHQGNSEFGACQVRTRVTIPRGMYLESISQSVIGGVIKSQGARGFMRSSYFMQRAGTGTPAFPTLDEFGTIMRGEIRFNALEDRNDAMLVIHGERAFRPVERQTICQVSRNRPVNVDLIMRAAVGGTRTAADQTVLIEVDSADVRFDVGAKLAYCP